VSRSASPAALVFGESVIDIHPAYSVVAGAPIHVAARLARYGWKVYLVNRVGADANGTSVRDELQRYGVVTDLIETDDVLPTGTVVVSYRDGDHCFDIRKPMAWDAVQGPDKLPAHDLLYFNTVVGRDPRSLSALERMLEKSKARVQLFDINLRPPHHDAGLMARCLARATLVKANEEEIPMAADILGFSPTPQAVFEAAPHLRWLCITLADRGARLLVRDGRSWERAPSPRTVVDTVGAGDAFAAALAEAFLSGFGEEEALAFAVEEASQSVEAPGGLP